MTRSSLFRTYSILALVVTLFFVSIGILASRVAIRVEGDHQFSKEPPTFFAELLNQMPGRDRIQNLDGIVKANHGFLPFQLTLADQKGQILYPLKGKTLGFDWNQVLLPEKTNEFQAVRGNSNAGTSSDIVRLPGTPPQFLVISYDRRFKTQKRHYLLINSIFIISSSVLATGFSLFLLLFLMRQKARLANSVISELQNGNLKARFPIKKLDEFGQTMLSFNRMADEIELLVERLKSTEQSRKVLLQELAHDLRTPIASLKNLIETQVSRRGQLTEEIKTELMGLSLKEVEYFQRLVEDLLFLARADDPRYQEGTERVNLLDLLDEEIEVISAQTTPQKISIDMTRDPHSSPALMWGDQHLLQRLFRNALDNAISFAKEKIDIIVDLNDSQILTVTIRDDGAGLTSDALHSFGKRRISRMIETTSTGRLSVGLGSVIMQTIALLHRGSVTIQNLTQSDGLCVGAELKIVFSRSGCRA